ncbi:uncharacterized protein LOC129217444 [Uloborus diversus]|uniref:uncharacterized protein LOC129217444 n=1 Tax=Uloborus diversus TaxID=327109 RepID=UPI00240A86AE|nr:uncharacterized protein LOC129217444 [Uloborus diversus]
MTVRVPEFSDPVVFTFQSDSQSSGAGFHIIVTQIPNTCPGYVVRPEMPPPQSRCYQEVDSHLGYFNPQSAGPRIMRCEFIIKKADPSVCHVWLQISSSSRFDPVPCMQNFIQLPSGDRMCASITERREIDFPRDSHTLTLIYYNLDNPQFNLIVSQIQNTCKVPVTVSYPVMNLKWRNS